MPPGRRLTFTRLGLALFLGIVSTLLLISTPPATAQTLPTLPEAAVDTTMPRITGNTYTVNVGGNFQAALNSAGAADPNLNHLIVLQVGATFTSPFTLPARGGGSGWILTRSALANIPPEGARAKPADARHMASGVTATGLHAVQRV